MNEHDSKSWRPCRAGEIAEVANSLVALRRRRLALQTFGSLCGVFLVIGMVLWLGPANQLPAFASITCSECRNQMHAYRSHTLSTSQVRMMDAHFQHCGGCQDRYNAQTQEQSNCDKPANCIQTDCDTAKNNQVSNCMTWSRQAQTCRASQRCKSSACKAKASLNSPTDNGQPL